MARLRNPSTATEPPVFLRPTSASRTTRSSPRKAVPELPSTRELRYSSSQSPDEFLVPKETSPLRKQRVLRPVASNSRLLRKLSDESLAATPDKKERRGREREKDVGSGFGLGVGVGGLYSKALAKSMVRKKQGKRDAVDYNIPKRNDVEQVIVLEDDEDAEKSILCDEVGTDEKDAEDEEDEDENEDEDEDDDDEPVISMRDRCRQPQTRRVISSSEEDSDEEDVDEDILRSSPHKASTQKTERVLVTDMPPPLTSLRPPFRKGHSQVSNWAQNVIDLTSSPEAPSSFAIIPPLRSRTTSFAASSGTTTSASNDVDAILHFSPTPTKQRSPRKAPPVPRPTTPPAPPSPSKLVSPSKKNPRIPHAPALRPSIDAFWDPETVNNWNDKHSPSKPLLSPRKQNLFKQLEKQMRSIDLSDDENEASLPSPIVSPKKKQGKTQNPSPVKKGKAVSGSTSPNVGDIRAQRKDFAARKHIIAEAFLVELDKTIANGKIADLSESTGGIKLVWSRTLKTTAGRANWRREQIRMRTGPLPSDVTVEIRHHCSIELAEKVIDDEERLYNVLAHEYCHLTTFMISEVRNNPHGAEFKSWGAKATRAFADKGVEVTTKHSYKIEYKYIWECVTCGYEFKRHSKSVDPVRHSCGRCKGKLVQTKPTPRIAGGKNGNGKGGEVKKSDYQMFVKEHFGRVKREMAEKGMDTQMGRVMETVAREYRAAKEEKAKSKTTSVEVEEVEFALEGLKI